MIFEKIKPMPVERFNKLVKIKYNVAVPFVLFLVLVVSFSNFEGKTTAPLNTFNKSKPGFLLSVIDSRNDGLPPEMVT